MSKTAEKNKKATIVQKFAQGTGDTGSAEVQVALLTSRIQEINGHIKQFPKDFASNRGLVAMVGQRRRLLNYLRSSDHQRYTKLINALELRK